MDASNLSPEEPSRAKFFNPLVLDRTVIAIPLLKDMEQDLKLIERIKQLHPEEARASNAAIEFNPHYRDGVKDAHKQAGVMVEAATRELLATAARRVAGAGKPEKEAEKKRSAALEKAIGKPVLGPIVTDDQKAHYSFATMHAGVIRRLLDAHERLAEADRPIAQIYPRRFEIILDLNLEYPGGREAARQWVFARLEVAKKQGEVQDAGQVLHLEKDRPDSQYLFARLEARAIQKLVELDMADAHAKAARKRAETKNPSERARIDPTRFRAIFHIWPDFEISACINKSIATVKADAAQNSFSARGAGIAWAVMDSGIDRTHRHFAEHSNLDVPAHWHKDFTTDGGGPFDDRNGHGTHVAGIIAGEWRVAPDAPKTVRRPVAVSRYLKKDTEDVEYQQTQLDRISGMAPRCKLVSLRVLDENGKGAVSNLIAAISHVQEINGYGRRLLIHGVNLSVGYNFEPEWFACGQSPLCVEVDRLVKSGVIVVVAAGNTGYGTLKSSIGVTSAGMALTINDPGNADLAITVGSTHRDMPHIYGVSYFSSKGPTGDGRLKPDLVAPGEKIISCGAGMLKTDGAKGVKNIDSVDYVETSGTSMAAPHVSGVIAAFLSVRTEFIGQTDRVKQIFTSTATDLRRDRYFQGAGLVDLMRAIQSV